MLRTTRPDSVCRRVCKFVECVSHGVPLAIIGMMLRRHTVPCIHFLGCLKRKWIPWFFGPRVTFVVLWAHGSLLLGSSAGPVYFCPHQPTTTPCDHYISLPLVLPLEDSKFEHGTAKNVCPIIGQSFAYVDAK